MRPDIGAALRRGDGFSPVYLSFICFQPFQSICSKKKSFFFQFFFNDEGALWVDAHYKTTSL
jgi:hypothetical protein